jgi:hypothetical protein
LPAGVTLLNLMVQYHIGDVASVAGVVISLIGFAVTLVGVWRSSSAALLAQNAAESARNSIRAFETVVDINSAIKVLEELKVAHRRDEWVGLPERYAALRKTLIEIRTAGGLADEQASVLQSAIANLKQMEEAVERALPEIPPKMHAKFNARVSANIDELTAVLAQLRRSQTGA